MEADAVGFLQRQLAAAVGPPPLPPPPPLSTPPASTQELVHANNLSTCVLVVLVMSWSLGGHHLASRTRYLTEGSAACALGLLTGLILLVFHRFLSSHIVTQLLEFNAAGFFTYLLPPVIFYCGLSVEKSRFFLALPSILMYGIVGTLWSFIFISLFMYVALGFALFDLEDCLAMGAIFAATDSVATLQVLDPDVMPGLFSLVFGEGVVNDAVSVVLLGAVANAAKAHGAGNHRGLAGGVVLNFIYLLVTSLIMGGAAGLGIAWVLKSLSLNGPHQELSVITLLSYLSYLLADVTGLSAILSLFVCGVVVSHYALNNISEEGRVATMTGFRTAAYLAEGIIFIYVGMDALDPLKWQGANRAEAAWLVLLLTALLVVARAAFVVPFSLLHNMWSQDPLSSRDIVIVWWAGLMRGAVSVALVYYYFDDNPKQVLDRGRATLIVSTLMVVMLSILGFGALTKPLLAAMLKDTDAPIIDQLRTIPLLSNLARESSQASSLIDRVDNTFRAHRQRYGGRGSTVSSLEGSGSHGGTGDHASSRRGTDRGHLSMGGFAGFEAADADAAPYEAQPLMSQLGRGTRYSSPASAVAGSGNDLVNALGGVDIEQQSQQQQQQWGGLEQQSASLAGPPAAVEMQAAGSAVGAAGNNSIMTAMRHMGQAWDAFDRSVMAPVFGGPAAAGAGAAEAGAASSTSRNLSPARPVGTK